MCCGLYVYTGAVVFMYKQVLKPVQLPCFTGALHNCLLMCWSIYLRTGAHAGAAAVGEPGHRWSASHGFRLQQGRQGHDGQGATQVCMHVCACTSAILLSS
jgi:hypothetical protein